MQYDEHKLVEYFADAPAGVGFSDLDLNNIPHHISCIMDGNGRWATSRGLARTEGHKAGIVSLREIITPPACVWASTCFRPMRFLPKTGTVRSMRSTS